jgi:hypothetical protein
VGLRLLILLAGTRIRLAPRWLCAQPRRRPAHTMLAAVLLPAFLGLLLAALLVPGQARACHHVPSKVPGQVRLTCANAPPGAR